MYQCLYRSHGAIVGINGVYTFPVENKSITWSGEDRAPNFCNSGFWNISCKHKTYWVKTTINPCHHVFLPTNQFITKTRHRFELCFPDKLNSPRLHPEINLSPLQIRWLPWKQSNKAKDTSAVFKEMRFPISQGGRIILQFMTPVFYDEDN